VVVVAGEFDGGEGGVLELTDGVEGSPPTIGVLVAVPSLPPDVAVGGVDVAAVVVPVPGLLPVPPLVGTDGGVALSVDVLLHAPACGERTPFVTRMQ